MHLEPVVGVDRRFGPLPDVADHVEQSVALEAIHRTGRSPVLEVDVAGGLAPVRLIGVDALRHQAPFVLGGQPDALARSRAEPVAERLGLEVVDVDGPVPRHVHLFEHRAIAVASIAGWEPEQRVARFLVAPPTPPFVGPPSFVLVAAVFDEGEVFVVRNQVSTGLEAAHVCPMAPVLDVPPIERVLAVLSQGDAAARHIDERVVRGVPGVGTDLPVRHRTHAVDWQLPDQYRRRFQMNPLVLDAHHHDPERAAPVDR